jgi:hypothetical protein
VGEDAGDDLAGHQSADQQERNDERPAIAAVIMAMSHV